MANNKKTGLGRGLDSIFLDNTVDESGSISMLRISEIEPNPDQPRRDFDPEALQQLADSIAANGLIQPIVVRSSGMDGYYQIIAGERRWRASKMAGLTEVPVVIMELDNQKAAQVALIENLQREDLNAIETALAFRKLLSDYSMTQEELSKQVGKSRSAIANSLRLLDLSDAVADMIRNGQLSEGHGRAVLSIKDKGAQIDAAKVIASKGMSVREAEAYAKKVNKKLSFSETEKSEDEPFVDYTAVLTKKMTQILGKKVAVTGKGKVRKLEISFSDDKELDELVSKLCGNNIFDD